MISWVWRRASLSYICFLLSKYVGKTIWWDKIFKIFLLLMFNYFLLVIQDVEIRILRNFFAIFRPQGDIFPQTIIPFYYPGIFCVTPLLVNAKNNFCSNFFFLFCIFHVLPLLLNFSPDDFRVWMFILENSSINRYQII